jgi:hypothetical protein
MEYKPLVGRPKDKCKHGFIAGIQKPSGAIQWDLRTVSTYDQAMHLAQEVCDVLNSKK